MIRWPASWLGDRRCSWVILAVATALESWDSPGACGGETAVDPGVSAGSGWARASCEDPQAPRMAAAGTASRASPTARRIAALARVRCYRGASDAPRATFVNQRVGAGP